MVAINPLKADQQRPTVAALLVPMANGLDATRSQPMATYQGLWLWPNAALAPGDIVSIPKATERSERYLFDDTSPVARSFSLSRALLRDGLDIHGLLATVIGRDVEGHLLLLP
jgi:hypothetical protein